MIEDRFLIMYARRKYGPEFADDVARVLRSNRHLARYLRRTLTNEMRHPE
jgi:hypothetical protein